jgi:HYR domain/PKD domain
MAVSRWLKTIFLTLAAVLTIPAATSGQGIGEPQFIGSPRIVGGDVLDCGGMNERPCSLLKSDYEAMYWWGNGNFGCDRGLKEKDGKCVNDKRRQDVGKPFRQTSLGRALAMQLQLNWDTPLDIVPEIMIHNAFENHADGYPAGAQDYSITELLDAGFRTLELDVWTDTMKLAYPKLCHFACSGSDRYFASALKEVRDWLKEPGHELDVLVISIENWIKADESSYVDAAIRRILAEDPAIGVWTGPPPAAGKPWPSRRELLQQGKRVVFFTSNSPGWYSGSYIQFDRPGSGKEWSGSTLKGYPDCTVTLQDKSVHSVGLFSNDVTDLWPWPDGPSADQLTKMVGCGMRSQKINQLLNSKTYGNPYPDPDRLESANWSWEADVLSTARPNRSALLFPTSGRWIAAGRLSVGAYLCGLVNPASPGGRPSLIIASNHGALTGTWDGGFSACAAASAGTPDLRYTFWAPRNALENEMALEAAKRDAPGLDVWLNFTATGDGEVENWIVDHAPKVTGIGGPASVLKNQYVEFPALGVGDDDFGVLADEGLTLTWDFGDGATETTAYPFTTGAHVYHEAGPVTIKVRVTDRAGAYVEASRTITVTGGTKPQIYLVGPTALKTLEIGEYLLQGYATEEDQVSVVSLTCYGQPAHVVKPNTISPPNPNLDMRFSCQFPGGLTEMEVTATIADVDGETIKTLIVRNGAAPTGVASGPARSRANKVPADRYYFDLTPAVGPIRLLEGSCGNNGTPNPRITQTKSSQYSIDCTFAQPGLDNVVSLRFTDDTDNEAIAPLTVVVGQPPAGVIEAVDGTSVTTGNGGTFRVRGTSTEGDDVSLASLSCKGGKDGQTGQVIQQFGDRDPGAGFFIRFQCSFPNGGDNDGKARIEAVLRDVDGDTSPALSLDLSVLDVTRPVVSINGIATSPPPITVDATSTGGREVFFTATATDNVDAGELQVGCKIGDNPVKSGDVFHYGTKVVTCSALDKAGNAGSATFNVIVNDRLGPVLALPATGIVAEAQGPDGAVVNFDNVAFTDNVDGNVPRERITCTPLSPAVFGIDAATSRTTTVSCSATDALGNPGTGSFTVTVVDTRPPTVTVPPGVTVPATGVSATVAFTVSASDLVDGAGVPVICNRASGSSFPLGKTTVTCAATDKHGNRSQDSSFDVTVEDKTAPALTVANVTAEATGPNGAPVAFTATAIDLVDPRPTLACVTGYILPDGQVIGAPVASGQTFPIGETRVSCRATDASGNAATASFTVTVRDTIAPVVSYSGNAASYSADQLVDIRCTATDGGSGVASTTCAGITGPAYSFALGTNTFSATATDAAGNIGRGSASFAVIASAASLQDLVSRFCTNAGVADGLNAKLAAAAKAPNANPRAGQLGAFENQVRAQRGKALTAEQADTLLRLVAALY